MAKKKKSQRKRNFAYSSAQSHQAAPAKVVESSSKPANPIQEQRQAPKPTSHKLDYIRHDIRTILVLAAGCVSIEILLWFLLHHTGLSSVVFGH